MAKKAVKQNDEQITKQATKDKFKLPEGCRTCGGPYLKCKIGCPAFDD